MAFLPLGSGDRNRLELNNLHGLSLRRGFWATHSGPGMACTGCCGPARSLRLKIVSDISRLRARRAGGRR